MSGIKDGKIKEDIEIKFLKLEDELKQLAGTIDTVEDEKLEVTNQLKKALADYQNLERSINSRIETRVSHLKKGMADSIIEVLDDLKFAEEAKKTLSLSENEESWADGMVASVRKINKALDVLGITEIEVEVGGEFNANKHEAMAVVDAEEGDVAGAIKQVVQTGYEFGELVIRPARVLVTKK
jgi:molecular chaperone GrpE